MIEMWTGCYIRRERVTFHSQGIERSQKILHVASDLYTFKRTFYVPRIRVSILQIFSQSSKQLYNQYYTFFIRDGEIQALAG